MHFIHLFFFQSNGREIRHVILVSVSWHTLLSITAHHTSFYSSEVSGFSIT